MTFNSRFRAPALLLGLVLSSAVSACVEMPTSPSGSSPFSQSDLRAGTGVAAANGNELAVAYTGWFYDGSKTDGKGLQFDTSAGRGPLEFVLGMGEVIPGWDVGLVGMRVGGLRRLVVPPSLAYGGARNGIVPANATLVFDIELLEVRIE